MRLNTDINRIILNNKRNINKLTMSRIILSKTETEYSLDTILNFVLEHYVHLRTLFDCDPRIWTVNVIQYLKDQDIEPEAREIIAIALTRHFCSSFDWVHAITEEFEKWIGTTADPKPVKTKTHETYLKKDITMTPNTNTQINVADLLKVKMMEKLMDGDTKDLNLGKMTVVQALANGQTVDFGEVMKAKMTEKLLKAVEADEDIPLGKLLMLQAMTTNPNVGEVMKVKMTEKLLKAVEADEDIPLGKMLMLQAMTTNPNFGINDLVQLKLMEKLLDEPEAKTETKPK